MCLLKAVKSDWHWHAKALAYCTMGSITAAKSFMIQAPVRVIIFPNEDI